MRVQVLGERKVWMWFCSYILKNSLVEKKGSFNESYAAINVSNGVLNIS